MSDELVRPPELDNWDGRDSFESELTFQPVEEVPVDLNAQPKPEDKPKVDPPEPPAQEVTPPAEPPKVDPPPVSDPKLSGKFVSEEERDRAYREAEAAMHRSQQEAAEFRKMVMDLSSRLDKATTVRTEEDETATVQKLVDTDQPIEALRTIVKGVLEKELRPVLGSLESKTEELSLERQRERVAAAVEQVKSVVGAEEWEPVREDARKFAEQHAMWMYNTVLRETKNEPFARKMASLVDLEPSFIEPYVMSAYGKRAKGVSAKTAADAKAKAAATAVRRQTPVVDSPSGGSVAEVAVDTSKMSSREMKEYLIKTGKWNPILS